MDQYHNHAGRDGPLLYGVHKETGALLHVRSSAVRTGLACNCICPGCRWPLVAAKGEKLTHHFKHQATDNGETRECSDPQGARESIVHERTKQIISEMKSSYFRSYVEVFPDYRGQGIPTLTILDSRELHFKEIEVEPPRYLATHSLKPDLLIKGESSLMALEVKYSHACTDEKISRFKELGWFALELDMSDVNPNDLGRTLVELRLRDSRYAKWLSRPFNAKIEEKVRVHHQFHINRIDEHYSKLEMEKARIAAKERAKKVAEVERLERERRAAEAAKEQKRRAAVEHLCQQKADLYYTANIPKDPLEEALTDKLKNMADALDWAYLDLYQKSLGGGSGDPTVFKTHLRHELARLSHDVKQQKVRASIKRFMQLQFDSVYQELMREGFNPFLGTPWTAIMDRRIEARLATVIDSEPPIPNPWDLEGLY